MVALDTIEDIGWDFRQKLQSVSIKSPAALLHRGGARSDRRLLAALTGIDEALLLSWVHRADLMRVRGIGADYSDLLQASGVRTIGDLARRHPTNLVAKMMETNRQAIKSTRRSIVRRVPSVSEVERWVDLASVLDPVVT